MVDPNLEDINYEEEDKEDEGLGLGLGLGLGFGLLLGRMEIDMFCGRQTDDQEETLAWQDLWLRCDKSE